MEECEAPRRGRFPAGAFVLGQQSRIRGCAPWRRGGAAGGGPPPPGPLPASRAGGGELRRQLRLRTATAPAARGPSPPAPLPQTARERGERRFERIGGRRAPAEGPSPRPPPRSFLAERGRTSRRDGTLPFHLPPPRSLWGRVGEGALRPRTSHLPLCTELAHAQPSPSSFGGGWASNASPGEGALGPRHRDGDPAVSRSAAVLSYSRTFVLQCRPACGPCPHAPILPGSHIP